MIKKLVRFDWAMKTVLFLKWNCLFIGLLILKKSIPVNLQNVKWDLEGINILLNGMVDKSELELAGGIVGNQASNQADLF